MFNLSRVTQNPNIGQPFTIIRETGAFGRGGWQTQNTTEIAAFGVIGPPGEEELAQIPEGDRVKGVLQVLTNVPLYATQAARAGISDKVRWHGDLYSVTSRLPWGDAGYWSAILLRTTGD